MYLMDVVIYGGGLLLLASLPGLLLALGLLAMREDARDRDGGPKTSRPGRE